MTTHMQTETLPVVAIAMISLFFYYVAHLSPVLVIIIHVQPKPIVFHQNIGPSPSRLSHSNSLHHSPWIFLLAFSPCWPALMTSGRVHYDFFVHPRPFWVVWPLMRFPIQFALVQLHFFEFDPLCNSPMCVLFPLESMF